MQVRRGVQEGAEEDEKTGEYYRVSVTWIETNTLKDFLFNWATNVEHCTHRSLKKCVDYLTSLFVMLHTSWCLS